MFLKIELGSDGLITADKGTEPGMRGPQIANTDHYAFRELYDLRVPPELPPPTPEHGAPLGRIVTFMLAPQIVGVPPREGAPGSPAPKVWCRFGASVKGTNPDTDDWFRIDEPHCDLDSGKPPDPDRTYMQAYQGGFRLRWRIWELRWEGETGEEIEVPPGREYGESRVVGDLTLSYKLGGSEPIIVQFKGELFHPDAATERLFEPSVQLGAISTGPLADADPVDYPILDCKLGLLFRSADTLPASVEFLSPQSHLVQAPPTLNAGIAKLRIRISDPGFFDPFGVEFLFSRTLRDGTTDQVRLSHLDGAWVPDVDPPGYLRMDPPADADGTKLTTLADEAFFEGTVVIAASVEQMNVRVLVRDCTGNETPAEDSSFLFQVVIPTEVVLLLDYSGSMRNDSTGQARWETARQAANMFLSIYTALVPPDLGCRIGVLPFFAEGATGQIHANGAVMIEVPRHIPRELDGTLPDSSHHTPIGSALLAGHRLATITSILTWRERVLILLTDGRENREPLVDTIRAATSGENYLPNRAEDPKLGAIIHACAFGAPEEVDTAALQRLLMGGDGLKSYDGQLHSTETLEDPTEAFGLKRLLLVLLADALHADLVGPKRFNFTLDPGISAVAFVVTGEVPFTVRPPADFAGELPPSHQSQGYAWVRISDPTPGTWVLEGYTPDAETKAFALLDLRLKANFDAGRTDLRVGRPITLRAEIREAGSPVTGARVEVEVAAPVESVGHILTDYLRTAKHQVGKKDTKGTDSKREGPSPRHRLLAAALEARRKGLQVRRQRITLQEISPGRYEGAWQDTEETGTYAFTFHAAGRTRGGQRFERDYTLSRHLEAVPDSELTRVSWRPIATTTTGSTRWQIAITPRTATNRPLGPGFANTLSLLLRPLERRDDEAPDGPGLPLSLNDASDGSYLAELNLAPGAPLPEPTLRFGTHSLQLGSQGRSRRVRVTLERVRLLGRHEPWFTRPGQMHFESVVIPNGDPHRAVRCRIPAKGAFTATGTAPVEVDTVIFDDFVERGATLGLLLGGVGLDPMHGFVSHNPLARYRRFLGGAIQSWAGTWQPGDERDDPEALADWQLWYRIDLL